eukprot:13863273-Heterocapsa_arctica.AAC.1
MTEIGLKEIEKCIGEEHVYNSKKFGNIMDDIEDMNKKNKRKQDEMETERVRTEESEEEEEDQLPGAKANDMNKFQMTDVKKWLDDNPQLKADAMQVFDKKLMDGTGEDLSQAQELLSGRIFDTLIGSPMGKVRDWKTLELQPHSLHRWFPWGTVKNHFMEAKAWKTKMTDEEFWGVITETTNHREYFHSHMVK